MRQLISLFTLGIPALASAYPVHDTFAGIVERNTVRDENSYRFATSEPNDATNTCELTRLNPPNPTFELGFAASVAIDDNVAVVASPNDTRPGSSERGAAYVYRFDGHIWAREARLSIENYRARFGSAVAVSDDVLLVGAPEEHRAGTDECGAVHVYRFDGTAWAQETVLRGHHAHEVLCAFGYSVALRGDVAVVGAPGSEDQDSMFPKSGAVIVFRFDGTEWVQEEMLTAPTLGETDHFGISVAIDDSQVLVGAPGRDLSGIRSDEGAAYLFRHDGVSWSFDTELVASDPKESAGFGRSIAIRNDIAVIGAARAAAPNCLDCGAAYVYRHSDGTWSEEAKLVSAVEYSWEYGSSVATDGNLILVGAADESVTDRCFFGCGAAYLYRKADETWLQEARLAAPDEGEEPNFGRSAAMGSGLAVIGAPRADCDPRDDEIVYCGAAYAYAVSGDDCNANGAPDVCDLQDGNADDCNANGVPDECDAAEADCDNDGVPDDCEEDADADGLPDECDACPDAAANGTIALERCDSGVPDQIDESGCPFSGHIASCLATAKNHGDAVSCITRLAGQWRRDGAITGEQHGRITACAARGAARDQGIKGSRDRGIKGGHDLAIRDAATCTQAESPASQANWALSPIGQRRTERGRLRRAARCSNGQRVRPETTPTPSLCREGSSASERSQTKPARRPALLRPNVYPIVAEKRIARSRPTPRS